MINGGQRTIRKWFSDPILLKWVVVFAFVIPPPALAQSDPPTAELETGTINGALYTIANPSEWSGELLLVAHGLRQPNTSLSAGLNPNQQVYAQLLAQGWMVAVTSYRRNGFIVSDAIDDLGALRLHIEQTFGKPDRVFVMGNSMGGAIGTLIAETRYEYYDGVLAIGAALSIRDDHRPFAFNHQPQIPLLFLSNQSEIAGPRDYVRRASKAPVVPAVWKVSRDGHVNVNDSERLAALKALNHFIDSGEIERGKDGTVASNLNSSAEFVGDTAINSIISISENHGNIFSGFVAADLQRLGISINSHFQLTLGTQTVRVFWGTNYHDVGRGEWVAFISADDSLMIARNTDNACATVSCKTGDPLILFR